jgi:hypothetical protein
MKRALLLPLIGTVIGLVTSCESLTPRSHHAVYSFPASRKVEVHLIWEKAPDPYLYSDKGPMRSLVFTEGNRQVSVDSSKISAIEDFWLDKMRLTSSEPGNFKFTLPFGVGEPSSLEVLVDDYHVIYP